MTMPVVRASFAVLACVMILSVAPAAVAAFGGDILPLTLTDCAAKLLAFDFSDIACLKFVIKKALGYGIIAGACVVKLPQLFNMVRARSSTGISEAGTTMETLANLSTATYHLLRGTEPVDNACVAPRFRAASIL